MIKSGFSVIGYDSDWEEVEVSEFTNLETALSCLAATVVKIKGVSRIESVDLCSIATGRHDKILLSVNLDDLEEL